jgi:hypothetical protein
MLIGNSDISHLHPNDSSQEIFDSSRINKKRAGEFPQPAL